MATSGPALSARRVHKRYGAEPVLSGVDLIVDPGEIHALVGMNGVGKTSLMRLLLGMTRPDGGAIRLNGCDPLLMESAHWSAVGHFVESPLAYPELTVLQNLEVAGRLAGLSASSAKRAARRLVDEWVLTRWAGISARKLSLGNRQRVGLAAALAGRPSILVLDEPTNGLDPAGVLLVRNMLMDGSRERGMAALVSSHHLDEVARVADKISVLNRGRMIGHLDPGSVDLERQFFALVAADEGVAP